MDRAVDILGRQKELIEALGRGGAAICHRNPQSRSVGLDEQKLLHDQSGCRCALTPSAKAARRRASRRHVLACDKKRVLMLLENCPFPRDDRVRRETRTLVAAGYSVTVVAPLGAGEPWEEVVEGAHVYRFAAPAGAKGFIGYLWEYGYSMAAIFLVSMRVLWREGFDIVHAHHPPDTFAFVGAFYKLLGKRYVFDHHDLAPELYHARFGGRGNRIVYSALVTLEKFACRVADHVITTNESYKAIELQRGDVPEQRITVVRNGPDMDESRAMEPRLDLRQQGKTIIGYVGVTGTQDGMDYLLRALHRLIFDLGRRDFFCIVVGSGDALPGLKSLAQGLGIADYVLFTGWVDEPAEVARYVSTMDICVAPEPSDPYNDRSTAAKVMEYMALGKPTVAFDLPEHRFTAQGAAIYARPNEEFDFARQIVLLMDDPELRRIMGAQGKARIETVLAWSKQERHLIEVYDTLFQ